MITRKKRTMGMTAVVGIVDADAQTRDIVEIFTYFSEVDKQFSTYKKTSEVERINRGEIPIQKYSTNMKKILTLSQKTKNDTNGFFDIFYHGKLDPSGIVKGYAIHVAAKMLAKKGYRNYFVEIGGDIEVHGKNKEEDKWRVGVKNPFQPKEVVKVLQVSNKGVATSGTYIRGNHIYNPHTHTQADKIASITVVGPNIYEADRMATAAFAMGEKAIQFIESLKGFEGYMITLDKRGVETSGLKQYLN